MTKTETAPAPRFVLGSFASPQLVVPSTVPAPPEVRKASDELAKAFEDERDLGGIRRDAAHAAKVAPLDDSLAVSRRDAERDLAAATAATRAAAIDLLRTIASVRSEWLVDAQATAVKAEGEALAALDRTFEAVDRVIEAKAVAAVLSDFPSQGSVTEIRWPSDAQEQAAEARLEASLALEADDRMGGNFSTLISRTSSSLFAAIRALIVR